MTKKTKKTPRKAKTSMKRYITMTFKDSGAVELKVNNISTRELHAAGTALLREALLKAADV